GQRPEPIKAQQRRPPAKKGDRLDSVRGKEPAGRRPSRRRPAGAGVPDVEAAISSGRIDDEDGGDFERVTDGEDLAQIAGEMLKDAIVQEKIIDRVQTEEFRPSVSAPPTAKGPRVGSLRSKMSVEDSHFQRVIDEEDIEARRARREAAETGATEVLSLIHEGTVAGLEDQRDRPERVELHSDERHSLSPSESASTESSREDSAGGSEGEGPENADAELRDRGSRAEFALRRGGRSRRRRREPPPAQEEDTANGESLAGPDEQSEDPGAAPVQAAEVEPAPAAPSPRPDPRLRQPDNQRRAEYGAQRPGPGRKPEHPTISELLREGQEILVQIAKEPIAKKGARITSHIALPGRYLVYMPTVNHIGVSRKIGSELERVRLKRTVTSLKEREGAGGGFIVRTACEGHSEQELQDDMRYLLRTWGDVKKKAERSKSPALIHRDLDLVQRILRDHLSDEFTAIRVDNETEYARLVEFVNRIQPKLVKRVKLYVGDQPILEKYGVQQEVDKALKPRVWLKSGGYIVINQTEALVAIDVNTGKFVGKSDRLEDTITRTNLEAVKEIVRQVRLRDLGGIIVLDLIDMEERKNRQKVMAALQQELQADRAPSKILSINDFGLVAITRKRVKQSLERTLCSPCPYCQGAGLVKSAQTMCFEILEQSKAIAKQAGRANDVTLRVAPDVAEELRSKEREVFEEIEAYFNVPIAIEADPNLHREQFDFAIM
ncbi:MAG TPA: Rne/Rng family ribonuclease, partial [Blastocatellia bacterium]|nr:Rne/Rng family ribonuclease [Blastocatellia bacterium]